MDKIAEEIRPIIDKYQNEVGALIPALQEIQEKYKYIPKESIEILSKEFHIPVPRINGVITFYAQFRTEPVGKHIIRVCHGTACFVNNGDSIMDTIKQTLKIDIGETTKDKFYTIEQVACLGCCSLAPVIMIDDKVFGKLDSTKVKNVLKKFKEKEGANE